VSAAYWHQKSFFFPFMGWDSNGTIWRWSSEYQLDQESQLKSATWLKYQNNYKFLTKADLNMNFHFYRELSLVQSITGTLLESCAATAGWCELAFSEVIMAVL